MLLSLVARVLVCVIRGGGGAGGHGGVKSVQRFCGSPNFSRLKVGIAQQQAQERKPRTGVGLENEGVKSLVLGRFRASEMRRLFGDDAYYHPSTSDGRPETSGRQHGQRSGLLHWACDLIAEHTLV